MFSYIGLIVSITSAHLIIAADIEEFKQFAKKVVPGNVVEKLFEIVSQNKAKNKDNNNNAHEFDDAGFKEDNIYSYEYEEEESPKDSWQFVQYPSKAVIRQGNFHDSEAIHDEIKDANQPAGNSQRAKPTEVNVDDLVEKVRQRLLDDFQKSPPDLQKFLGANVVSPDFKDEINQRKTTEKRTLLRDSDNKKQNQQNRPERQKNPKPHSSKIERKDAQSLRLKEDDLPEIDAEGNVRVLKDHRQKNKQDFIFEELNLNSKKKEKDTYEDYVTPKREENIFVSEENMSTTKQARSSPRLSQRIKETEWQDIFNYKLQNGMQVSSQALEQTNTKASGSSTGPYIYNDSNEITTPLDLKARTENLWFDYTDERNPKMLRMDTEDPSEGKAKKFKHGTMMPTRETYKMTSPNYYGQMPTVAEKYNFDEPIPEKDREIENLKPIGNPPANINGRIRV